MCSLQHVNNKHKRVVDDEHGLRQKDIVHKVAHNWIPAQCLCSKTVREINDV